VNNMTWDGHDLMAAMRHAGAVLHSNLDEVNALNVFPVPDGDTGSNMLATIQAAVAEAESVPPLERTPTRISSALSLGALMGARGNSGVILSQLLRGIGEAIAGHERVDAPTLAKAFKRGCAAAFSAVAHPVEGTMLTVARDVAEAAEKAPPGDGSIEHLLRVAVDEAAASVERTPSLLPVLKEAGVVDAGGRGIELLLRGALASIQGDHLPHGLKLTNDIALPTWDALEAEGYGYETVFVILPPEGARLDVGAIRSRLDRMAESVLVAGDDRAVKIHVHNERPDEVIGYGLTLGTLSRITIENLDRQATDVRERARTAIEAPSISGAAPLREGPAVIAVAAGDGLARVFSSLGATAVVQGGQGANPSVGELADAIRASQNDQVIVLPNNPNVRMAAKQAGDLCPGIKVEVVPTRNAGEGVAALLAFDPDTALKDAAKSMTAAGRAVQTLQVSVAVRDARMGRRKVRSGDYIVLGPSDGLVATDTDRTAAIRRGIGELKSGFELLTLYRGRDVDHAAGQQLRDELATSLDGVEIELVEGGQPHYDFLISAE
jgi:DAK2 domain fusion protein YloV